MAAVRQSVNALASSTEDRYVPIYEEDVFTTDALWTPYGVAYVEAWKVGGRTLYYAVDEKGTTLGPSSECRASHILRARRHVQWSRYQREIAKLRHCSHWQCPIGCDCLTEDDR